MKPTGGIEKMHLDMSGAAVVLSSLRAAAAMGMRKNISACVVLAENAIDANSYYPFQILKSHKGLTVEVGNTDAEGRLCLADAMTWMQEKYGPHDKIECLVELSTLTGACIVALGEHAAGLFSNSDRLADDLHTSGKAVGEVLWRMPIL